MPQGTRICKICGKEYPYCVTYTEMDGNRWQDVGCCIEHATEYFREVAIARGELVEEEPKKSAPKTANKKEVEKKGDDDKKSGDPIETE